MSLIVSNTQSSYYKRKVEYVDGKQTFQTAGDELNQRQVAAEIEKHWGVTCKGMGRYCAFDWTFLRGDEVVAIGELKGRDILTTRHLTVWLNVRKWTALTLTSIGLRVPAFLVVKFNDATRWIGLTEFDAAQCRLGGCIKYVKSNNDIEPVIDVPIIDMKPLTTNPFAPQPQPTILVQKTLPL